MTVRHATTLGEVRALDDLAHLRVAVGSLWDAHPVDYHSHRPDNTVCWVWRLDVCPDCGDLA